MFIVPKLSNRDQTVECILFYLSTNISYDEWMNSIDY